MQTQTHPANNHPTTPPPAAPLDHQALDALQEKLERACIARGLKVSVERSGLTPEALSSGVDNGERIASAKITKLSNGKRLTVHESSAPAANAAEVLEKAISEASGHALARRAAEREAAAKKLHETAKTGAKPEGLPLIWQFAVDMAAAIREDLRRPFAAKAGSTAEAQPKPRARGPGMR